MLEKQEKILEKCECVKKMILHLNDEIYGLDLSADQKENIITLKFELLSDFQRFESTIKNIIK